MNIRFFVGRAGDRDVSSSSWLLLLLLLLLALLCSNAASGCLCRVVVDVRLDVATGLGPPELRVNEFVIKL